MRPAATPPQHADFGMRRPAIKKGIDFKDLEPHDGSKSLRLFSVMLVIAAAAAVAAPLASAQAEETCFHVCLKPRMTRTDIDDRAIRAAMAGCRDECDARAAAELHSAACVPTPIEADEFRKIRSASPSVIGFANAFIWDVNNVLGDKTIRRIEIAAYNLSMQEVTMTATGVAGPGRRATFLVGQAFDGYPAARLSSRVTAIYACPAL